MKSTTMKTTMLDKPISEQWMEIIKTVLVIVTPLIITVWKLADTYSKIRKEEMASRIKDAIDDVVTPKFDQLINQIKGISEQQSRDREQINNKIDQQSRDFNKQVLDLMKEIKK